MTRPGPGGSSAPTEREPGGCVKTEWKATDSRWWPLRVLVSLVVASVPLALGVVLEDQPVWTLVAFPVAAVLQIIGAARSRLRLTDAGVEVRRLRTRLYRWSDIASVERAPEWEGTKVIWLRLRGSVPSSAPEVLVPPGPGDRDADGQTLDAIVSLVRRRAGLELERPTR
ncbi:MAG: hypothetical protein ACRYG2_30495 [Janthinobacterium lividum]